MNIHELKKELQNFFTDGLVTIVGSGPSIAQGLPSLADISDHLVKKLGSRLDDALRQNWEEISVRLTWGDNLENVLREVPYNSDLMNIIAEEIAELIRSCESIIVKKIVLDLKRLPFSRLLPYLLFNCRVATIITTNYDRLIEIAAESVNIRINTSFAGQCFASFDPEQVQESLCYYESMRTKKIRKCIHKHILLLKPHGSIDWFEYIDKPIRSSIPIACAPLMITPGLSKYRKGYDSPFDYHREKANEAIRKASRYLIIGYGFNDDHLETHLRKELTRGKPCLILTKALTTNGQRVLDLSSNVIALSHKIVSGKEGTFYQTKEENDFFEYLNLWDLDPFLMEVLRIE